MLNKDIKLYDSLRKRTKELKEANKQKLINSLANNPQYVMPMAKYARNVPLNQTIENIIKTWEEAGCVDELYNLKTIEEIN